MGVKIEVYGETGAQAAEEVSQLLHHLGARFQSIPLPVAAPAAEQAQAEAPKPTRTKKNQPVAEQPAAPVEPTPLEKVAEATKSVEATKAETKPVEQPKSDEKTFDEAACRAGLQKLHSVITGKKDSPSGIEAAKAICQEFGIKKVSELKPEQYKPFCDRIEAAIAEAGK